LRFEFSLSAPLYKWHAEGEEGGGHQKGRGEVESTNKIDTGDYEGNVWTTNLTHSKSYGEQGFAVAPNVLPPSEFLLLVNFGEIVMANLQFL